MARSEFHDIGSTNMTLHEVAKTVEAMLALRLKRIRYVRVRALQEGREIHPSLEIRVLFETKEDAERYGAEVREVVEGFPTLRSLHREYGLRVGLKLLHDNSQRVMRPELWARPEPLPQAEEREVDEALFRMALQAKVRERYG